MSKEFNWAEFNAVLQRSKNICQGARDDIANAIAAGKGEVKKSPPPAAGQVYLCRGGNFPTIRILVESTHSSPVNLIAVDAIGKCRGQNPEFWIDTGFYEFVADSLKDYLSAGGKL